MSACLLLAEERIYLINEEFVLYNQTRDVESRIVICFFPVIVLSSFSCFCDFGFDVLKENAVLLILKLFVELFDFFIHAFVVLANLIRLFLYILELVIENLDQTIDGLLSLFRTNFLLLSVLF